jgi:hypothetical protein
MKVPIVDNIWDQVLEYRSNFQVVLSLKHINNSNYSVCLAPSINERVNQIDRKLIKILLNYTKLGRNGKHNFESRALNRILRTVAQKYKINVDSATIDRIISEDISLLSPEAMLLNKYFRTIKNLAKNYDCSLKDEFLGLTYSSLLGTDDLTEFYRTTEIENSLNKVVINKLYLGVPSNTIESSMDSLFNFLETSTNSLFVKATCALYYFYYVVPFEAFSEEMSVLLFKEILARNDLGELAIYLNAESLLLEKEQFESFILESQKTLDLTYFLNYILKKFEHCIEDLNEILSSSKVDEIAEETYSTEPVVNQVSSEEPKEEIKVVERYVEKVDDSNVNYNKNIAISEVPDGLNEEEANKLETHLLELHPELSRAQAYFYARHCTIGMKYTIAQFKRELGCAYETARTSMDTLVYLGFYRKEPLKNKYIYTPVKKG